MQEICLLKFAWRNLFSNLLKQSGAQVNISFYDFSLGCSMLTDLTLIQWNFYMSMLAQHEHGWHNTKEFLERDLAEVSMTIIFLEFFKIV